jgi:hypothetical protein
VVATRKTATACSAFFDSFHRAWQAPIQESEFTAMADPKIRIRATDDTSAAFRTANANLSAMQASAERTQLALSALVPSLLVIGTAVKLANLFKSVVDGIDAFNDLADATGSTIENLSALDHVASLTGTSFDTVGAALLKFNQSLKDAKPGSDAEAAFKALGLSIGELKSQDPSEALRLTSVALAGFASDGNKARLVQELFGKSVKEVAPFLKNLAEVGSLVATVTTKQAEEAEKFNRQLALMSTYSRDAARTIGSPLVETFNNIAASIQKAAREQTGWFASMESLRAQAAARSDALYTGTWSDARGGRGFVNPAFVLPSLPGDIGGKKDPAKPVTQLARDLDLTNRALASYTEQLQNTITKTQDLTTVEEALIFLRRKGAGASLDDAARILNLARQVDETKRLHEETQSLIALDKTLEEQARAKVQARDDNLQRLLDATPTAQLEKSRADIILLTEEFQKFIDTAGRAGINEQTYLEAVSARLDLTGKDLEKTKSIAEELGLTFQSAFEDAVIGGKSFSDVLKGIEQDILRIVVRKSVTEPLGKFVTGAIGNLFSFDGGGYTGGGSRSGGVDGKGGFLAVMHPQETVVDHTKGQGAGGAVVINNNFTVGDVASISMVQRAIANSQKATAAAWRRSLVYGNGGE